MAVEWEEIARRGKNHAVLIMDEVAVSYKKCLIDKIIPGLHINNYRQFDGCRWFGKDDARNYIEALKSVESKQKGSLLKFAEDYIKILNEKREWADQISTKNYAKLTNAELADIFDEHTQQNLLIVANSYHYIYLNKFYPDKLTNKISQLVPDLKSQTEILKTLFALDTPSDMRREKESILNIAKKIKEGKLTLEDSEIHLLIQRHCREFGYLGFYYYCGKEYGIPEIELRLKSLIQKDLEKEFRELREQDVIKEETKGIIEKLNLDEDSQLAIKTIKAWGYAANYFDETYNYFSCKLQGFLKEIEKRLNIDYNQLVSMRSIEISQALREGHISEEFKKKLSDRFLNHALVYTDNNIIIFSGKDFDDYYGKELGKQKDYSDLDQLTGQSASPGHAEGRVHLVLSVDEVPFVKKDEILVASATSPSFVPAMEKASAIVTDEGGLLSHAAIVSRELRIPCVVGTKIGTKTLKDGDIVEVDANDGIVKIIKKAE